MSRLKQQMRAMPEARAFPIHAFGAYRQRGENEALHFLGTAEAMPDAQALASDRLLHKDTLLIHQNDPRTGKQWLHAFKVRQGAADWRKNPQTGIAERWHPLKLDALFSVPVEAFAPTRPFDAFRDDPVGIDPQLVDARVAAGGGA